MIMRKLFFTVLLAALATGPGAVSAQQARVALKGNAYMIKDGKAASLEVDGKIVCTLEDGYVDFKTATGNYFAAEFDDGRFVLLNRKGSSVVLGPRDEIDYYKISLVSGTVVAQKEKDSKPKYHSEKDLSVEITPQAVEHDFFEKEIEKKTGQPVFNPEKMAQGKSSEQAEYLSSLVPEAGRFEIRPKPNSTRQQIYVRGKMIDEAQEYKIVSTPEVWNEWGYWILITKNGGYYGLLGIEVREENGNRIARKEVLIPHKYTYGIHHDGNMLKFTKRGGVPEWFNWWGYNFDNDWRTGKFTPTYKQWVQNKSTGEWSLVKQEPKE